MSGLLYKNFLFFKIELIIIGIIQGVVSAVILFVSSSCKDPNEIYMLEVSCFFLTFILSDLFNSGLFAMDEKNSFMGFIISSPKGAKSHIQSKYYTILIINCMLYFCCYLTDTAVCGLMNSTACSSVSVCVIFFSISLIINAISVPFLIKCGAKNATAVISAVFGVIVLLVGIYALFGDISMFLVDDLNELQATIMKFATSGNALLIISLIPYMAIILFYLSYRISLSIYTKGAVNYD